MFSTRVRIVAVVLVCILALAVVAIVQAQNGRGKQNPPSGMQGGPDQGPRNFDGMPCPTRLLSPPPAPMMQWLARELQMSEQQQKQATEMVGVLAGKIKQIAGSGNPTRDLIAELKAETTNADKVKDLGAQVSKQEAAVLQAQLEMWVKYEQMLTPEQRAKFWTLFPRQPGPMGPPPGSPRSPGAPGSPNEPPTPRSGN